MARQDRVRVAAVAALAAIVYASASACTEKQLACISTAQDAISALQADADEQPGAVCLGFTDAYAQLAACVGSSGCNGADISDSKTSCLEANATDADCVVDCSAIASSRNALDSIQEDDEATLFAAYGNASLGAFPSATYNGRQALTALQSPSSSGAGYENLWSLGEPGVSGGTPVETSAGEFVVVTADGFLVCTDVQGNEVWTASPLDAAEDDDELVSFVGQPIMTAWGEIIIADDNGVLYRLDETSGEVVKVYNLGGAITATPAVARDYVYVSSRGIPGIPSMLHKLPIVTDAEPDAGLGAWRRPVCDHDDLRLDWPDAAISLASDGAVVVACHWTGYVDTFDPDTGDLLASALIEGSANRSAGTPGVFGPPVLDGQDNVFVTIPGGGLVKFGDSGESDFAFGNLFADDVEGALAINRDAGVGYALDNAGTLYRFNVEDGSLEVQRGNLTDEANTAAAFAPVIDADGNVAIARASEVIIFDENLAEVSRVDVGSAVLASPSIAQGTLLVATEDAAMSQVGAELLDVPATSAPTSSQTTTTASPTGPGATPSPTPPKTPPGEDENNDNGTGDSQEGKDGWPTSAIAVVSILAILDAGLLGAVGVKAYKGKSSVGEGAKTAKLDEKYDDMPSTPPSKSPPQSAPASPGAIEGAIEGANENQVAQA